MSQAPKSSGRRRTGEGSHTENGGNKGGNSASSAAAARFQRKRGQTKRACAEHPHTGDCSPCTTDDNGTTHVLRSETSDRPGHPSPVGAFAVGGISSSANARSDDATVHSNRTMISCPPSTVVAQAITTEELENQIRDQIRAEMNAHQQQEILEAQVVINVEGEIQDQSREDTSFDIEGENPDAPTRAAKRPTGRMARMHHNNRGKLRCTKKSVLLALTLLVLGVGAIAAVMMVMLGNQKESSDRSGPPKESNTQVGSPPGSPSFEPQPTIAPSEKPETPSPTELIAEELSSPPQASLPPTNSETTSAPTIKETTLNPTTPPTPRPTSPPSPSPTPLPSTPQRNNCSIRNDADWCTNGDLPEINLGLLSGSACREQCEIAMAVAGMTPGCWIMPENGYCYCRSGRLGVGGVEGVNPGGPCGMTEPVPVLECELDTNVSYCTDGVLPEINLGPLTASVCRDKCELEMAVAGMTSGCWVLAGDGNCYCRDGTLGTGKDSSGGACRIA